MVQRTPIQSVKNPEALLVSLEVPFLMYVYTVCMQSCMIWIYKTLLNLTEARIEALRRQPGRGRFARRSQERIGAKGRVQGRAEGEEEGAEGAEDDRGKRVAEDPFQHTGCELQETSEEEVHSAEKGAIDGQLNSCL